MLKQGAESLPDMRDRVVLLLLMVLFLLLGVAWGVEVTAELKSRSTPSARQVAPLDTTAAIPQAGEQKR